MQTATSPLISVLNVCTFLVPGIVAFEPSSAQFLEPPSGPAVTPGKVLGGPSGTMAQITISTQDQKSVTSNLIFTASQSSGNSVIDNTVTQPTSSILQLASSSSNSAVTVIQLPNIPVAQNTSPISYLTSSSSIPLTPVPNLSGNPMTQPPKSIFQRTSSSSTSAVAATQVPSRAVAQSTSSINSQTSSTNILPILMPQLPSRSRAQATSSANHQTSSSSSSSPAIAVSQIPNSPISQSSSSINYQTISTNSISPIPASQLPEILRVHSTSSSSTLATADTQLSNNPISQSPSSINHQSSSSFNNDTPTTQTGSSSSSNSNPSHILPSDPMLTDHPPSQTFPATTLAVIPRPLATPTIVAEGTVSSAVGLANATLAGMGILPPGVSAMPGKVANSAIESGVNGIEVVQIFPITTLMVSTVSLVPAAATSAVEPIDPISASMSIVPPGTSATLDKPVNSAIQSGGNAGGGGNGSSVVTGSGSTTGSGNPTESVSGHTSVPIVSTGGAEGVNGWAKWWLGFGILVWGVGMVYWM